MRVLSQCCLQNQPLLTFARVAAAVLFLTLAVLPAQAARHRSHRHGGSTATYYSRGDSNPHLANGDYYGQSGPRFSRGNVDISRGGSSRLSGRGAPDNFPVEWHDLGPAPSHAGRKSQRHHTAKHR